MKILMIDKFYFVKGGVERYLFELKKLLEKRGHEVIPFSMLHPDNQPTPYSSYFVDHMDFESPDLQKNKWKQLKTALRILYSFHAKKKLGKLIKETKPDIAHLHMIDHQLSPSILHTLKKYKIPSIQTVHQYKLVCPNYRFYIDHRGEICERCLSGNYFHAALNRCHKKSLKASMLLTMEAFLHKFLGIYKNISRFHVPSQFIGKKIVEGGIPAEKIVHHFLTLNMDEYPFQDKSEDYFLYYGRLSGEKGLMTLLKAMRRVKTGLKLFLVGDGPVREALERFARNHKLETVQFIGYKSGRELKKILAGARFVVVPSEWYENSPFVIYEPFCMGKPVIGASIGGIPEFIRHEKTGLLFEPGDADKLAEYIDLFASNPELCRKYGQNARAFAEENFRPEDHCEWLVKEYEQLKQNNLGAF